MKGRKERGQAEERREKFSLSPRLSTAFFFASVYLIFGMLSSSACAVCACNSFAKRKNWSALL
jgi:hypothetical protein